MPRARSGSAHCGDVTIREASSSSRVGYGGIWLSFESARPALVEEFAAEPGIAPRRIEHVEIIERRIAPLTGHEVLSKRALAGPPRALCGSESCGSSVRYETHPTIAPRSVDVGARLA